MYFGVFEGRDAIAHGRATNATKMKGSISRVKIPYYCFVAVNVPLSETLHCVATNDPEIVKPLTVPVKLNGQAPVTLGVNVICTDEPFTVPATVPDAL